MGRRLRAFHPRSATHLTAHGVDAEPIFRSDLDRFDLLARMRRVTERAQWRIVAWCFMSTHYHLLVISGDDPRVSWAMQAINSVYAREFNHRHRRRGHLFGERFTDTLSSQTLTSTPASTTSSRTRSAQDSRCASAIGAGRGSIASSRETSPRLEPL